MAQPKAKPRGKPGPKPLTKAKVLAAIKGSYGIMTSVAKKLGTTPGTAKKYVHMYPEALAAFQEEHDQINDLAESWLLTHIKMGDFRAVKFTLNTIGKNRGYTERHEITGEDGEPIRIEIVDVADR